MSDRSFNISIVFKGDVASAKAAATEMVKNTGAVRQAVEEAVVALDAEAGAIDRAATSSAKAAPQMKRAADAVEAAAKGADDGRARFDALRTAMDPAFASSQRFAQVQREVATALESGAASQGAANVVLEQAAKRYMGVATAAERAAAARLVSEQQIASVKALRAQLDPLYATTQAYERALDQIGTAKGAGFLSDPEAARLSSLAATRYLTPQTPAATNSPEDDPEELRQRYVPLYKAQKDYEAELGEIRKAQAASALSADEAAAAEARLKASYDRSVESLKRADAAFLGGGQAMKLTRFEAQNLSYQLNDVFTSLASGIPITQVVAQQGGQITQVFGGVGNTFRAILGFLTPTRLLLGGVSAAALAGIAAWRSYDNSINEVSRAAEGLGRATAGSSEQMEAAAERGAAAAGLSVKAARSMEAEFLRTGKIGSENFQKLISISRDFGATMGLSAKDAGDALSQMFADPAKAAETLSQQYGLIDAATARQVENLAAQNRVSEAQAQLLDALPDRLVKATEHTTLLGRAWETVTHAASNAWDAMGKAIDRAVSGPGQNEQVQRAQLNVNAWKDSWIPFSGLIANHFQKQVDTSFQAMLEKDVQDAQDRALAAAKKQGTFALGVANASPATERDRQQESLRNSIAALQSGQDKPGLDADQRQRISTAIEAQQRALDALTNSEARAQQLDMLDIRIQNERNPLIRANLEAQRTRLQLSGQEISAEQLATQVTEARNRALQATFAAADAQISDMQAELEIRQRLDGQVAAGAISTDDANRKLQEELQLRPLVAAAAVAEGDVREKLTARIEQQRNLYELLTAEQKKTSLTSFLQTQQDSLDELQTEAALLGATADARTRALAELKAEQQIRAQGLGAGSREAAQLRQSVVNSDLLTAALHRQIAAWQDVQQAAGQAVDDGIDKLLDGDISGGLKSIGADIKGLLTDLAIKNPLKNALTGQDLPTLNDAGGLSGILGKLLGGGDPAAQAGAVLGQHSVSSMTVTAGSVTIAGGLSGLGGSLLGGGATGAASAGTNSGVASQVWSFFAQKGLKPWQIAGIMGNVSAESGFNPLASGDNGNAVGLFQHNDRAAGLLSFLGGRGNLGDVQGQLQYVWQELQTTEKSSLLKLLGSTNVSDATAAFAGFERPQGYSAADPTLMSSWTNRISAANDALVKFGATTGTATGDLGTLGSGFDSFGQGLAQLLSGQGGSSGGGLFSSLLSPILSAIGIPGFDTGGWTGGSDPKKAAGIVHEGEYVFDAPATSRIGVARLEALRKGALPGFRNGGHVPPLSGNARTGGGASGSDQPILIIQNQSSAQISGSVEQTTDAKGRRTSRLILADAVGSAMTTPGGGAKRTLRDNYGLKQAMPRR